MNKKRIYTFVFGASLLALGIISLIESSLNLGFLRFLTDTTFLAFLVTIGGLLLIYDSISLHKFLIRVLSILAGLIVAILGLFTLLLDLSLLKPLPYIATLTISPAFLEIFLIFIGFYIIINDFI